MASASATRSLQAIKPHLPLIKFRKGSLPFGKDSHTTGVQNVVAPSKSSGNAIDDSHLPPKYARKPLTDIEMAFIMRGGPE